MLIIAKDKGGLENESCREEMTNDPAISWELARCLRLPNCNLQFLMFPVQELRKLLSGPSAGSFACGEFSDYGQS